ncbi:D-alanyl-D-alanine carboxypeptidase family protein [Pseudoluteimonas lycopersici]|uniref:D-alanyl-D-alanine carboxypeptidase family protein n=1 Tax=Pseudoluteimonas lycopersici TaxID=1324796 RepID=A0A516V1Y9_9GAMM|nr:M15 family metallopeptidase [Lysobacter lycopersici]QDQ72541.1 D-alanyl-D-alanine carboxypeptidase family protein [Lysobacter lycopersici]
MRRRPASRLVNTPEIELWPASLLRARSNHDARVLSRADTVLRRKRDGRYLAADSRDGLMPLVPRLKSEPGLDAALDALDASRVHGEERRAGIGHDVATLPLSRLYERLDSLGLDADAYAQRSGLALVPEPEWLAFAGFDRWRRPLWLLAPSMRAWTHLREAALRDDVVLEAISGYRSHDYQLGIFERKLARGEAVDEILAVNAAPGFSEHHAGTALDIGTPGEPPAEESFEKTPAFAWLRANAGGYGFAMSYPRDNPHGIVYEPWHWHHTV